MEDVDWAGNQFDSRTSQLKQAELISDHRIADPRIQTGW